MNDNVNVESAIVSPNSNVILDEFTGIDIPNSVIVNPSGDSKDIKLNITMTDKSLTNSTTDNVNDNDKPKTNRIENIDNTITDNKPKGYKNLVPITSRPMEEQREIQRKGGKARAEQMKQRMTMKENLNLLLQCKLSNRQSVEIADEFSELLGEDTSVQNVLMIQTLKQAMSGDTKAIALVRDTIGEKPIDESVVTSYTPTPDDMEMISNVRKRLGLEE